MRSERACEGREISSSDLAHFDAAFQEERHLTPGEIAKQLGANELLGKGSGPKSLIDQGSGHDSR